MDEVQAEDGALVDLVDLVPLDRIVQEVGEVRVEVEVVVDPVNVEDLAAPAAGAVPGPLDCFLVLRGEDVSPDVRTDAGLMGAKDRYYSVELIVDWLKETAAAE